MHERMKKGDTEDGSILRRTRYPVQLWELPHNKGKGFEVCLWVTDTPENENYLWSYRKHFDDANQLFENTCHIFPNLTPEL